MRNRESASVRERANLHGKVALNKLLLAIPDSEYKIIRPHLEFVDLPSHLSLHEPHRTMKRVYFPNRGLISLVVDLTDGKSVEAGLLGNEGVSGMTGVLGLRKSPIREIVQVSGNGFSIKVSVLKTLLRRTPDFQATLGLYAAGLAIQVAQTAACNRVHKIEQRLARWLLIAQDKVSSSSLFITHDFLATMLGTDRPSVTIAAGILQKMEIIECGRGKVHILSRANLEKFACECYAIVRDYDGRPTPDIRM